MSYSYKIKNTLTLSKWDAIQTGGVTSFVYLTYANSITLVWQKGKKKKSLKEQNKNLNIAVDSLLQ